MSEADVPAVSVIVIHYRRADLTAALVAQLARDRSAGEAELLVVDNASPEPLPAFPGDGGPPVRVVRSERNAGYAAACNLGARAARGASLLFCNNDLAVEGALLGPLLAALRDGARPGVVGPALVHADGRFQLSWGEDPGLRSEWRERRRQRESRRGGGAAVDAREASSREAREVDWLTGACLLVDRAAFDAVGGFDEEYFFYFEDSDFCRRVRRAGRSVRYHPALRVTHYGGSSAAAGDARLAAAYRLGQLRYYSLYNTRISFFALKLYLGMKLLAGPLRTALPRPARAGLARSIRAYPWRVGRGPGRAAAGSPQADRRNDRKEGPGHP